MLLGNVNGLLAMMDSFKASPDIKTFSQLLEILPPSTELEEVIILTKCFVKCRNVNYG